MSRQLRLVCALGLLALVFMIPAVRAEDPRSPNISADDETMARLEALLEAQRARIDALQQQVAANAQADMNAARVEQMKQQIREVLSEKEFRESLMPTTVSAGYDNGFFIRSSDDKFLMKFNGQLQFRYTYYATGSRNRYLLPGFKQHDRSGFDIVRLNFDISGHAYTKDLTYFIELGSSAPNGYNTALNYGWVNYRFLDEFQVFASDRGNIINHRAPVECTANLPECGSLQVQIPGNAVHCFLHIKVFKIRWQQPEYQQCHED